MLTKLVILAHCVFALTACSPQTKQLEEPLEINFRLPNSTERSTLYTSLQLKQSKDELFWIIDISAPEISSKDNINEVAASVQYEILKDPAKGSIAPPYLHILLQDKEGFNRLTISTLQSTAEILTQPTRSSQQRERIRFQGKASNPEKTISGITNYKLRFQDTYGNAKSLDEAIEQYLSEKNR